MLRAPSLVSVLVVLDSKTWRFSTKQEGKSRFSVFTPLVGVDSYSDKPRARAHKLYWLYYCGYEFQCSTSKTGTITRLFTKNDTCAENRPKKGTPIGHYPASASSRPRDFRYWMHSYGHKHIVWCAFAPKDARAAHVQPWVAVWGHFWNLPRSLMRQHIDGYSMDTTPSQRSNYLP
jgi:hypothetical protein